MVFLFRLHLLPFIYLQLLHRVHPRSSASARVIIMAVLVLPHLAFECQRFPVFVTQTMGAAMALALVLALALALALELGLALVAAQVALPLDLAQAPALEVGVAAEVQ